MSLNISIVVFMCFIAYALSQTYTKLLYDDCGSRNVQIRRLDVTPMPIIHPGPGKLSLAISATEKIKGVVKANLTIVRTVATIKLPISCYTVQGEQVGSCVYQDLCALMKRIINKDAAGCPAALASHGIDCNCPLDITTNDVDFDMDIDIPVAPETVSWISVGDFDVKLQASIGNIFGCYTLKFSVKPKPKTG